MKTEMLIGDFRKYKWFYTSTGKLVVGGKSAIQNDILLSTLKETAEEFIVMHTSEPGSPFSIILESPKSLKKEDLDECAIFTGCFSRAWKDGKTNTSVDIFKLSQLHKSKGMKEGTWGVNGKIERTSVKLELALTKQKEVLRAVPIQSAKSEKNIIIKIKPGKIDKLDIAAKIELELDTVFDQEELLSAIPAGGISLIR